MTTVDKIGRFLASTMHYKMGLTQEYQWFFKETSLYRYFLGLNIYGDRIDVDTLSSTQRQEIILTIFLNQMWESDIISNQEHETYHLMNKSTDVETQTLLSGILEVLYPQMIKLWIKKHGKIPWVKIHS